MIDRRRFLLASSSWTIGLLVVVLPGCGGDSTPEGVATPTEYLDVDESGSPPDAQSKTPRKKAR